MYKICYSKKSNASSYITIYEGGDIKNDLIDAVITKEINMASVFEFTITPDSPYYDSVDIYRDIVTVYDDEDVIFEGFVTMIDMDAYLNKKITCEGFRSLLNNCMMDSTVPQLTSRKVSDYLNKIIYEASWQTGYEFTLDTSKVTQSILSKTLENLEWGISLLDVVDSIIDTYGGVIDVVRDGSSRGTYKFKLTYSNFVDNKASRTINPTPIELFRNLTAFASQISYAEMYSACFPVGKDGLKLSTLGQDVEGKLVIDSNLRNRYGIKFCMVEFENCDNVTELRQLATDFLAQQKPINSVEISAIDLSFIEEGHSRYKLGELIKLYAPVYGFDGSVNSAMELCQMTINLLQISSNTITLGMTKNALTKSVITRSV